VTAITHLSDNWRHCLDRYTVTAKAVLKLGKDQRASSVPLQLSKFHLFDSIHHFSLTIANFCP